MKKNDFFKFDAPNNYDFINNIEKDNSIIEINNKNDCWFFVEHFLHFTKKQNPIKKKLRKNRSCSLTIKVSLKLKKEKRLSSKLIHLMEIEEKPKKFKKTIRKTKMSTSLQFIPKNKTLKFKESFVNKEKSKKFTKNQQKSFLNKNKSKSFLNKNKSKSFPKKTQNSKSFINKKKSSKNIITKKILNNIQEIRKNKKYRNKRKKFVSKIKLKQKIQIDKNESITKKNKSTSKKTKKSRIFLYEPQIYNKSITKSYESFKGIKWYQLNMRERKLANREIERLLKENVI